MVCGGSLSHLSQLTGMLEQKRALIQTEFLKEKKKRPFSDKGVGAKYLNKGKQNSDLPRSLNVLSLQHCHRGNKVLFNSVTT